MIKKGREREGRRRNKLRMDVKKVMNFGIQ